MKPQDEISDIDELIIELDQLFRNAFSREGKRSREQKIVAILRKLKKLKCSFNLVEGRNLKSLWIFKYAGGEEIRRSIKVPNEVEAPFRKTGITP
ncbi:hypothetical protein AKJ64_01395 [candidate division MSBL1 archaeon SCGC-AAA259E17]|uniref:Uncharacterized protein n=1 Tax=candidate division MSBL1 archaeon SCGC-AAA259E17 TaxID=1698263 RepID=A0A133UG74_9EURY|nr:hypothetical protein AKJ64_01395 [candidate division MSBL1 archaeon SCGC-AAA259E17]